MRSDLPSSDKVFYYKLTLLEFPLTSVAATVTQKMVEKKIENFFIFSWKGKEKKFCFSKEWWKKSGSPWRKSLGP